MHHRGDAPLEQLSLEVAGKESLCFRPGLQRCIQMSDSEAAYEQMRVFL